MEFKKLSDVPAEIAEFYSEDDDGVVVLQSAGEHKTVSDLERIIALGRSNSDVILDKFAVMVERHTQWTWFQEYLTFMGEHATWVQDAAAFEPTEVDGVFTVFTVEEPQAPLRPQAKTGEEVLAPYWRTRRVASYGPLGDLADALLKYIDGDDAEIMGLVAHSKVIKAKYKKVT